jgi:hypothetical protein
MLTSAPPTFPKFPLYILKYFEIHVELVTYAHSVRLLHNESRLKECRVVEVKKQYKV